MPCFCLGVRYETMKYPVHCLARNGLKGKMSSSLILPIPLAEILRFVQNLVQSLYYTSLSHHSAWFCRLLSLLMSLLGLYSLL